MRPTNEKLRRRAIRIVTKLTKTTDENAEDLLRKGDWDLPAALVAARWRLGLSAARTHLSENHSNVAAALSEPPKTGLP